MCVLLSFLKCSALNIFVFLYVFTFDCCYICLEFVLWMDLIYYAYIFIRFSDQYFIIFLYYRYIDSLFAQNYLVLYLYQSSTEWLGFLTRGTRNTGTIRLQLGGYVNAHSSLCLWEWNINSCLMWLFSACNSKKTFCCETSIYSSWNQTSYRIGECFRLVTQTWLSRLID